MKGPAINGRGFAPAHRAPWLGSPQPDVAHAELDLHIFRVSTHGVHRHDQLPGDSPDRPPRSLTSSRSTSSSRSLSGSIKPWSPGAGLGQHERVSSSQSSSDVALHPVRKAMQHQDRDDATRPGPSHSSDQPQDPTAWLALRMTDAPPAREYLRNKCGIGPSGSNAEPPLTCVSAGQRRFFGRADRI